MPMFLFNVPIYTQGMQRTWWPESGTIIVTGSCFKCIFLDENGRMPILIS